MVFSCLFRRRYQVYKSHRVFWEFTILTRRAILVAVTVILSSDRVWRYTALSILNIGFLFVHMLARVPRLSLRVVLTCPDFVAVC